MEGQYKTQTHSETQQTKKREGEICCFLMLDVGAQLDVELKMCDATKGTIELQSTQRHNRDKKSNKGELLAGLESGCEASPKSD